MVQQRRLRKGGGNCDLPQYMTEVLDEIHASHLCWLRSFAREMHQLDIGAMRWRQAQGTRSCARGILPVDGKGQEQFCGRLQLSASWRGERLRHRRQPVSHVRCAVTASWVTSSSSVLDKIQICSELSFSLMTLASCLLHITYACCLAWLFTV